MPSDRFLRTMNRAHRTIRALTLGRIGWHAAGMPVVELTTTGRVSGRPRTVLLTSPVHDDDRLVLIASRGGDPTHPAWYHNLVADPHVTVTTREEVKTMRARTADADERAALWPQVIATSDRYADYADRTDREIPVVILEPFEPDHAPGNS